MSEIDLNRQRAAQAAPSVTTADEPTFTRMLGVAGLFVVVLGIAAIVANQYSPRIISTGWGVFLAALGFASLAFHALRDTDPDIRRMYGFLGMALLAAGIILSIIPGREGDTGDRTPAFYLLPWGFCLLALGILFLSTFIRTETETIIRQKGLYGLLAVGVLLFVGSIMVAFFARNVLLGPGLVLSLLGLVCLAVYGSLQGVDEGIGRFVAVGLGVFGFAVLSGSLLYALLPTLLHDGPSVLLKANRNTDYWKVAGRCILVLSTLAFALYAQRSPYWAGWVKRSLQALCLLVVLVLLTASFTAPWTTKPKDFLVPHGLILALLGMLALVLSLTACSDSPLVVLTRREFTSLFVSPMAYLVLFGAVMTAAVGYLFFLGQLVAEKRSFEPIVRGYWGASVLGALFTTFMVPAITMRLFAEEKRSGTMEVLLTAPLNDWPIILSKFFAGVAFYFIAMLPAGLFLIPLRAEGGSPFDSRPVLSYYLMVLVCGSSFVGAGVFFSSFTKNQIVAAVLTFAWLLFLFLAGYIPDLPIDQFGKGFKQVLAKLGYFSQWQASLSGQLALPDLVLHSSIAAFWLFLTSKVLEARKWL